MEYYRGNRIYPNLVSSPLNGHALHQILHTSPGCSCVTEEMYVTLNTSYNNEKGSVLTPFQEGPSPCLQ